MKFDVAQQNRGARQGGNMGCRGSSLIGAAVATTGFSGIAQIIAEIATWYSFDGRWIGYRPTSNSPDSLVFT
jgi:hypothetical protein